MAIQGFKKNPRERKWKKQRVNPGHSYNIEIQEMAEVSLLTEVLNISWKKSLNCPKPGLIKAETQKQSVWHF